MNKKIKFLITGIFLAIIFLMTSAAVSSASYDVNTTTSNIGSYINGLPVGSTVVFQGGNYGNLQLSINKQLDIRTNGLVEFMGTGSGSAFTVNANNVNITGFKISRYEDNILISSSAYYVSINNNNLSSSSRYGINNGGESSNIVGNIVSHSGSYGIYNTGYYGNIEGNDLQYGKSYGIYIGKGPYTYVDNNIIKDHSYSGVYIYTNNVKVRNNYIENTTQGIYIGAGVFGSIIDNNTIVKTRNDGIYSPATAQKSIITNNTIMDSDNDGMEISGAGAVISNNTIIGSRNSGIYLNSAGAQVTNNRLINNVGKYNVDSAGIFIASYSADTLIQGNYINNTGFHGISHISGTGTTISGNTIENSLKCGIYAYESTGSIINNNLSNNGDSGLDVQGHNKYIANNFIFNNAKDGIWISANNLNIVNNTIINNINGINASISGYGNNLVINSNNISNNKNYGVLLVAGSDAKLVNNFINENKIGVQNQLGSTNISNNEINLNELDGIINYGNSVVAYRNNITNNKRNGISSYGNSLLITESNVLDNIEKGIALSGNSNKVINSKISGNNIGIEITGSNNAVINSTIENNDFAINIMMSNTNIEGSTIINNNRGIVISSGSNNNIINYNRILNNNDLSGFDIENNGDNNNANFNWWGVNDISGLYDDNGSNFILDYWYLLKLSSNDNETIVNATRFYLPNSNVNMSFTLALNNETIANNPNLLPYFLVNILFYNNNNVVYNITDDIRNTTYYNDFALSTITALRSISDNEDLKLSIGIEGSTVNVSVIKTVNVTTTVLNGDFIKYTITVTNHGSNDANYVVVSDILDSRLLFNSANNTNYNAVTGEWVVGTLLVGENQSLEIIAQVNGSGNISNTVQLSTAGTNIADSTTDTANITVDSVVNISILKSVNVSATVFNGDFITYTINVINNGPDDATNLIVSDLLDSRLIFNSYSTLKGTYNNITGEWIIGNLNNGEGAVLNIFVQINGTGLFSNIATFTVDQVNNGDNDSSKSDTNFTADTIMPLEPTVNITIVKSVNVSATIFNSDFITYTITVTNNGPNTATNILVKDVLDSRLSYFNSVGSQGTYDYITGNWLVGNLSVGESAKLEIFVKVNGNGTITNTATLTMNEKNMGNNDSSVSFNVSSNNNTVSKTPSSKTSNSNTSSSKTSNPKISSSKNPTKIILTNSKVTYGKNLQLNAKLSSNGKVLSGKYIKFYVNGKYVGQAKTNSQGLATLNYKVKIYGKLKISATFTADSEYLSFNISKTLVSPKSIPK
jgi:uncharacterized repeat protein (TIGR01451 family)